MKERAAPLPATALTLAGHQIKGETYAVSGYCYRAVTDCIGCLEDPVSYSDDLAPVFCPQTTPAQFYPQCIGNGCLPQGKQVVGMTYWASGACYKAMTDCIGCLGDPASHPGALTLVSCPEAVPARVFPECEPTCLTNGGNQIVGEIYKVSGKCYKALSNCAGCLHNPTDGRDLKTVPCPEENDEFFPYLGGTNDDGATNLGACFGECDWDAQCAAPLRCFQRTGSNHPTVPGCRGTGKADWDYCYNPTGSHMFDPSSNLDQATPRHSLSACIGECDSNEDCQPGLLCFQRTDGIHPGDSVPGCAWTILENLQVHFGDYDFCYDPNWVPAPIPVSVQAGIGSTCGNRPCLRPPEEAPPVDDIWTLCEYLLPLPVATIIGFNVGACQIPQLQKCDVRGKVTHEIRDGHTVTLRGSIRFGCLECFRFEPACAPMGASVGIERGIYKQIGENPVEITVSGSMGVHFGIYQAEYHGTSLSNRVNGIASFMVDVTGSFSVCCLVACLSAEPTGRVMINNIALHPDVRLPPGIEPTFTIDVYAYVSLVIMSAAVEVRLQFGDGGEWSLSEVGDALSDLNEMIPCTEFTLWRCNWDHLGRLL